jgi:hypothetical protein
VAFSLASSMKGVAADAKTGAQRLPAVPIIPASQPDALGPMPPGTIYASEESQKVFFQLDETTTIDLTAPVGGGNPDDIDGQFFTPRTVPGDRIQSNSLQQNELANGAVTGSELAPLIQYAGQITINSPGEGLAPLTLDIPFGTDDNVFIARSGGAQMFRVGPDSVAVGVDLPDSAFSISSTSEDRILLRGRGRGAVFDFRDVDTDLPMFTMGRFGDTFVGGDFVAEGQLFAEEGVSVTGPLSGVSQFNVIDGLQIGGNLSVGGPTSLGDQVTFSGAPLLLPTNYAARVGSNVWLRSLGGSPNRIILEGVSDSSVGQIQLGTGGPVLSGAFSEPGVVRVNGDKILTSLPGGILGSQIAFDTLTGGATAGQGNIAAQTVDSYNIKDATIVRANLSAGAVGTLQIADGSIPDDKIVDFAVSKLLSGVLDADEVYLGPHGTIYLGPVDHSHITDQRVQLNVEGLRSYN